MRTKTGEVILLWPLALHVLTAGYYYSDGSRHEAIDLRTNQGGSIVKPVYAAEDGTVDWVQEWDGHSTSGNQSYGNAIKIRHADYNGCVLETLYAHLDEVCVAVGDTVTEGQVIGYTGNSGNSSGPHLHFEVRLAGTRYNPLNWLDSDFDVASDSVRLGNFTSVIRPAEDIREYVYGIDVSKYQGTIDWKQVAASGVKFALLRVGSSTKSGPYVDPTFEANYKGCRDNGIAVGAYLYTYATSEADQNAELAVFLPALTGKTFEYPVFVDVEDNSLTGLGKDTLTALTKRMMDILDQRGYLPGWYSYTNYITNYLDAATLVDYPLWVADYRSTLGYTGKCDIWQYTSSGSVPGISGAVDLNRDYHGYNRKDKPTGKQLQIITAGPVDNAAAMILWGISNRYGLGYDAQYTDDTMQAQVLTIGPASAGDAIVVWAKAQELGAPYKSKYVEG